MFFKRVASMKEKRCWIWLENGDKIEGKTFFPFQEPQYAEAVFTTSMVGYPESLTDPSYFEQCLVFTYPLMGNYGVPPRDRFESKKIYAKGAVVSSITEAYSHFEGEKSLQEWTLEEGVPLIWGVDTRSLTLSLRKEGVMRCALFDQESFQPDFSWQASIPGPHVTIEKQEKRGMGTKRIIAVDCGMKENILRLFEKENIEILRVPFDDDYTSQKFDGVFLSNGPGDPEAYTETIAVLKKAMKKEKPIFGICLGMQLMALAAGAQAFKLKFGHRSHNQPCQDVVTKRCYLTSQNHGYAIDSNTLPVGWEVAFKNLNDGTVEGIRHATAPYWAVQFHPEAAAGPQDTSWMIREFVNSL